MTDIIGISFIIFFDALVAFFLIWIFLMACWTITPKPIKAVLRALYRRFLK